MRSADPQSGLYVTNGISSKAKKERKKRSTPRNNAQLPYNSLPPCNAATATTPLTLLISLTGHAPLKLLPEDARLDGVGAAVCVPAVVAFADVRVVGLADETWLVGEPVAEPDAGREEVVGVVLLCGDSKSNKPRFWADLHASIRNVWPSRSRPYFASTRSESSESAHVARSQHSDIVMEDGYVHMIIPACTFVKWSLPSSRSHNRLAS